MTKDEFYAWAERNGFEKDRWGHVHKGNLRFKVQAHTVRLESKRVIPKGEYTPRRTIWVKLRLGRLSKMSLTADDKIDGLVVNYD